MDFLGIDLNSGDPIPRQWFLLRDLKEPLFISSLYVVLCCYVGPWFMKNRKPFDLRKTMIVYNALLVFSYVYLLIRAVHYLRTVRWERFCEGGSLVEDPTDVEYKLVCIAYWVYIMKYVEQLDTVFFVLRKKNHLITKLHVIHHAVLPIVAFILFRTERSGIQSFPVIVNSVVHVLMYSYYCLAAMGPRYGKYLWWKRHLTQIQMTQFVIIVFFAGVVAPLSGCRIATSSICMNILLGMLFFSLFYNYYHHRVLQSRGKTECNGARQNGKQSHTE